MAISFIRTIILFVLIISAMRIMGKRQMGELEASELVVAVLISNLASNPLQDTETPLLYGIIPVITLVACEILVSGLVIKNIKFRGFICGKPSMIISDGTIIQTEMKKNRFTVDELNVELRKQCITDITTIKHAILETDGTLSILLYPDNAPVTPKHLNVRVEPAEFPVIVINDGYILDENLSTVGFNRKWLFEQLKSRNVKNLKDVFLMTVTSEQKIFFLKKDWSK